jgi:pimeloyl-ACP methyl ester carboxylesterase
MQDMELTRLNLPPAVAGERREISGRSGRLSYYVQGSGTPLLLLHSVNAAASAREVHPAFEHAAKSHRAYAPDLPGYGFSDRSHRAYDVALFCDAIRDMLEVIEREHGNRPVDALALSLSAEFLARVADELPQRFRTLTFVTPTGFQRGYDRMRKPAGSTREIPGLYPAVTFPLWRGALFQGLVSRVSVRYFLGRTFGSKDVPESLVDYSWRTAHQPGAEHAPFAFLSGRLFSADIRNVYERLQLPVWLAHGTHGDFADFSEAGWVRTRANWKVHAFDTGAMCYYQQPELFMQRWDAFLALPAK